MHFIDCRIVFVFGCQRTASIGPIILLVSNQCMHYCISHSSMSERQTSFWCGTYRRHITEFYRYKREACDRRSLINSLSLGLCKACA